MISLHENIANTRSFPSFPHQQLPGNCPQFRAVYRTDNLSKLDVRTNRIWACYLNHLREMRRRRQFVVIISANCRWTLLGIIVQVKKKFRRAWWTLPSRSRPRLQSQARGNNFAVIVKPIRLRFVDRYHTATWSILSQVLTKLLKLFTQLCWPWFSLLLLFGKF